MVTAIQRATDAPQLQPYLRDVEDHVQLVNEEVAAHWLRLRTRRAGTVKAR